MINNAGQVTYNSVQKENEKNNLFSLLSLAKKLTESVSVEDIVAEILNYFTNQLNEDKCCFYYITNFEKRVVIYTKEENLLKCKEKEKN
jgi:hypothetical protein